MVLDWALNMEKAGVHGSDFSFNANEVRAAQAATTTINIGTIGSFAGNLGAGNTAGNVTASDINVSSVQTLMDQIRGRIEEFKARSAVYDRVSSTRRD